VNVPFKLEFIPPPWDGKAAFHDGSDFLLPAGRIAALPAGSRHLLGFDFLDVRVFHRAGPVGAAKDPSGRSFRFGTGIRSRGHSTA